MTSGRYVVVSILQGSDIASDEVYGTWQTYEAAQLQADTWERKAARIFGDDLAVSFVVKQLNPKVRSRALADLWEQLGEFNK